MSASVTSGVAGAQIVSQSEPPVNEKPDAAMNVGTVPAAANLIVPTEVPLAEVVAFFLTSKSVCAVAATKALPELPAIAEAKVMVVIFDGAAKFITNALAVGIPG